MGRLLGTAATFGPRERLNWGAVAAEAPTNASGSSDTGWPLRVILS